MQEVLNRIKEDFYSRNFENWTYEDLLNELEKRKYIRVTGRDLLLIHA